MGPIPKVRRAFNVAILVVCGALAAILASRPAEASRIRPVNLEEMTRRAVSVFSGRCVEVRGAYNAMIGRPTTLVTFEVDRVAKGDAGRRVTIQTLGSPDDATGRTTRAVGIPRFRVGEEVVLFLYGESAAGMSAPVGLGQGKFSVVRDKGGRRIAINQFGNRLLLGGLSTRAAERLGDAARDRTEVRGIPPETLLDMAEALARAEVRR